MIKLTIHRAHTNLMIKKVLTAEKILEQSRRLINTYETQFYLINPDDREES